MSLQRYCLMLQGAASHDVIITHGLLGFPLGVPATIAYHLHAVHASPTD